MILQAEKNSQVIVGGPRVFFSLQPCNPAVFCGQSIEVLCTLTLFPVTNMTLSTLFLINSQHICGKIVSLGLNMNYFFLEKDFVHVVGTLISPLHSVLFVFPCPKVQSLPRCIEKTHVLILQY